MIQQCACVYSSCVGSYYCISQTNRWQKLWTNWQTLWTSAALISWTIHPTLDDIDTWTLIRHPSWRGLQVHPWVYGQCTPKTIRWQKLWTNCQMHPCVYEQCTPKPTDHKHFEQTIKCIPEFMDNAPPNQQTTKTLNKLSSASLSLWTMHPQTNRWQNTLNKCSPHFMDIHPTLDR